MDYFQEDRDLAIDFLSGHITPERDPIIFRDDVLILAIFRMDNRDPAWLFAQIANPRWPRELREQLAVMMPSHRGEALALLTDDD
ncbi:hypothetical protein [Nocardia sp. NBC_01327]|uniref:hypothetical protein n=1 Tax=Nocardia sp. NBC_01327 TaxID=2903593 RepID=UPI002E14F5AE|nr:hypothetical protein OG326_42730 [Nocardia sp. NBC_01327]